MARRTKDPYRGGAMAQGLMSAGLGIMAGSQVPYGQSVIPNIAQGLQFGLEAYHQRRKEMEEEHEARTKREAMEDALADPSLTEQERLFARLAPTAFVRGKMSPDAAGIIPKLLKFQEGEETVTQFMHPTTGEMQREVRAPRLQPQMFITPAQQIGFGFQQQAADRAEAGLGLQQQAAERAAEAAAQSASIAERKFEADRERERQRREDLLNPPPASKDVNTAKIKMSSIGLAKKQLAKARALYGEIKGVGDTINPASKSGREFDRAIDSLRGTITGLTRVPGIGAMSDFETRLDQAKIPSRYEWPEVVRSQMDSLDDIVQMLEGGYSDIANPRAPREQMPEGAVPQRAPAAAAGQPVRGEIDFNDLP